MDDEKLVTIDLIRGWLIEQVQRKNPIGPDVWVGAAQKMVVLLQTEQEKLFELEQQVALIKGVFLNEGKSVAYAKSKVEESDVYKQARMQKAKIENCLEMIRVAKLQARMSMDVMKGY